MEKPRPRSLIEALKSAEPNGQDAEAAQPNSGGSRVLKYVAQATRSLLRSDERALRRKQGSLENNKKQLESMRGLFQQDIKKVQAEMRERLADLKRRQAAALKELSADVTADARDLLRILTPHAERFRANISRLSEQISVLEDGGNALAESLQQTRKSSDAMKRVTFGDEELRDSVMENIGEVGDELADKIAEVNEDLNKLLGEMAATESAFHDWLERHDYIGLRRIVGEETRDLRKPRLPKIKTELEKRPVPEQLREPGATATD